MEIVLQRDIYDGESTGKDLIAPFVEAFRKEGLRIGFYHSVVDWHHPEYSVDGLHPMRDDLEYREANKDRDIAKYREYLHVQTLVLPVLKPPVEVPVIELFLKVKNGFFTQDAYVLCSLPLAVLEIVF